MAMTDHDANNLRGKRPAPLALSRASNASSLRSTPEGPPHSPRDEPARQSGYALSKAPGLPASFSLDSNLNTLLGGGTASRLAPSPALVSTPLEVSQRLPSASGTSSNDGQSSSSPESPRHFDRSDLVGLAELATPKWKTGNWTKFTDGTPSQPPLPESPSTSLARSTIQRKSLKNSTASYLSPTLSDPSQSPGMSSSSSSSALSAINQLLDDFGPDGKGFDLDQPGQRTPSPELDTPLSATPSAPHTIGLGMTLAPATPVVSAATPTAATPYLTKSSSRPSLRTRRTASHETSEMTVDTSPRDRTISSGPATLDSPRFTVSEKSPRSSAYSRRQSAASSRSRTSYASPNHIAHQILRNANTLSEGVEIDQIAAQDGGTAEALRKLDGIGHSPRPPTSRHSSGHKSAPSSPPPLPNGSGSQAGTPSRTSVAKDDASKLSKRLRTRSSSSAKDLAAKLMSEEAKALPGSSALPSPASTSSSPQTSAHPPSVQRRSQRVPSSVEPSSSVTTSQRGSTSSASLFTSNDGLSMTSVSSPGLASNGRQSNSRGARRSSASSDISAISEGSSRRTSGDLLNGMEAPVVPPVPPLPKDLQTRMPVDQKPDRASEEPTPSVSPTIKRGWRLSTALKPKTPVYSVTASRSSPNLAAWQQEGEQAVRKPSKYSLLGDKSPRLSLSHSPQQTSNSPSIKSPASSISSQSLSTIAAQSSPRLGALDESPRRRTPSGIPFFARKSSSSSKNSFEAPPAISSTDVAQAKPREDSPEKEKTGRKSILGLNFLGRRGDRKSAVVSPVNPPTSSVPSVQLRTPGKGRLSSAQTDTTTARKRGKTLPSSQQPVVPAQVHLPPMQMSAIPQTTARKIEHLTSSNVRSSLSNRTSRTAEGSVNTMPTIAGSPSVQSNDRSTSNSHSTTPTRIPRRVGNNSTSPQPATMNEFGVMDDPMQFPTSSQNKNQNYDSAATPSRRPPHRRTTSSASVSSIPRSRSNSTLAAPARSDITRDGSLGRVASGSSNIKRRSLLATGRDLKAPSPLTNRTPQTSAAKINERRNSLTSPPAASTTSSRIFRSTKPPAEEAKAEAPRVRLSSTATKVTSAARITKSTTLPSLSSLANTDERSRSASPGSSRGPTPSTDIEARADQEMAQFIRKQTSKKLASGVSSVEIKAMFDFPKPTRPLQPMSSREAIQLYGRWLCEYEHQEILDYKQVYYFGQNSQKTIAVLSNATNNYGYDDERGDYQVVMHDHIAYRYEVTGTLGKGSFGQVLECRDHQTGQMVAIKIIRNKRRFHHQALIEIKVLENLCQWDPEDKHNVIKMKSNFSFRGHLCIVTELLSMNLYELIKANNFAGFSTNLIRRFTVQMLNSLVLLRHHRVVHCDLKPENVLLKHPAKSAVQVIDFGSSCFENEKVYTYIQSRFYRSVEVIMGANYHMAIDMWSLGCIMAELWTGMPLFPGENEQEQLACIMEVLGCPEKHLVDRASRKKIFFDSTGAPRPVVNSKGRRRRPGAKTLAQVLKCDDEDFVDFIAKCLTFDPERRLKPQTALRHPFCRPELKTPSVQSPPRARSSRQSLAGTLSSTLSTTSISTPVAPRRRVTAFPATPQTTSLTNLPYTAPVARVRHTPPTNTSSTSRRVAV